MAIFGKFLLSQAISGFSGEFLAISDYFPLFLAISGDFGVFQNEGRTILSASQNGRAAIESCLLDWPAQVMAAGRSGEKAVTLRQFGGVYVDPMDLDSDAVGLQLVFMLPVKRSQERWINARKTIASLLTLTTPANNDTKVQLIVLLQRGRTFGQSIMQRYKSWSNINTCCWENRHLEVFMLIA